MRESKNVSRIVGRGWILIGAIVLLIPATGIGEDLVQIWENDGQPQIAAETGLLWNWTVRNGSSSEQIGTIRLYSIYSSIEPTVDTIPESWTMTCENVDSDPSMWDITLSGAPPFGFIGPADQRSFQILTYRPDTNTVVQFGAGHPCYAQARLSVQGFQPNPPGAPFVGPSGVGQGQPQFRISAFQFADADVVSLVLTNMTIGSTCTVERCFDLLSGDWQPTTNFVVDGPWTNVLEPASNDWLRVFYRATTY